MSKIFLNFLTAFTLLLSTSVFSQAPFANCPITMYLTQYQTPNGGTKLYTLDNVTDPLTITQIGVTSLGSVQLNGIGYNPIDNYIYGMNFVDKHLYRVYADGSQLDLGTVTGLPTNAGDYISGDIDHLGNYYVKENNSPNTSLYKINIATKTATLITLTQAIQTADFAYNKLDGLLYGVNQIGTNIDKLYSINPANGAVVFSTGITGVGSGFGAMYTDGITGAVYGNLNSTAAFYSFNKATGVATKVSNSISATGNDGAHCVNSRILFGVDLAITKTDGKTTYIPGTTNTYTIEVSNAGPFTALNSVVTDLVPTGIPATNVSYTAVASTGSSTSVLGTQTGAINDVVNIQKDGTITYTVTLTVPVAFSGPLVNTATVKVSADNIEANLSNNAATDTDNEGVCYDSAAGGTGVATNHGITLLQRAGGKTTDWPMVRTSAHTVLESNTKGFVITRMTTAQINAIVSPQEGMMVYDTDLKCLKINSDSTTGGWGCFNAPACPWKDPFPTVTTVTGKVWMDRNLGATQVATSSTDAAAFGDLYQWGRGTDGHEKRNSATTNVQSSTDTPGNDKFITGNGDWRTTPNNNLWQSVNGVNNPCPSGFRLPTRIELTKEFTKFSPDDPTGAFASPLKLTAAGMRDSDNTINWVNVLAFYWTSTINTTDNFPEAVYLDGGVTSSAFDRSTGLSVRCIKN